MTRVVLIGDSIRMGYQPLVQQELGDDFRVWGPAENGGDSHNVLAHLNEWVISRQPDVVHINCGLHDIKRSFSTGEIAVPLAQYRANVEGILGQIIGRTATRLIWATTTPVNQQWHHAHKDFDRFEADVLAYNEAALEIVSRLGVHVNDLFGLVMQAGRDRLLAADGVHYTDEGYELLAQGVAKAVQG